MKLHAGWLTELRLSYVLTVMYGIIAAILLIGGYYCLDQGHEWLYRHYFVWTSCLGLTGHMFNRCIRTVQIYRSYQEVTKYDWFPYNRDKEKIHKVGVRVVSEPRLKEIIHEDTTPFLKKLSGSINKHRVQVFRNGVIKVFINCYEGEYIITINRFFSSEYLLEDTVTHDLHWRQKDD